MKRIIVLSVEEVKDIFKKGLEQSKIFSESVDVDVLFNVDLNKADRPGEEDEVTFTGATITVKE